MCRSAESGARQVSVRGGLAEAPEAYPRRVGPRRPLLPRKDHFKHKAQIAACEQQLLNDFPRLWRSQIRAVMAETNHTLDDAHREASAVVEERGCAARGRACLGGAAA